MLLLLSITALAADDSFYPDEGDRQLSISALQAEGSILGRSGRLLLALRDPSDLSYLSKISGVSQVRRLRGEVISLSLHPGTDDLALARKLHADPHIAWVHPDLILPLRLHTVPNDPFVADEWHVEHIDLPLAWDYASGAGQIIAVVDSGVQVGHPDLRLLPGVDLLGDDTDPTPDDGNGHGTSVAGVAASIGNNSLGTAGVAWDAEVYPVRMIGGATTNQDVYDAITGSVDAGAAVVNNSWGFGSGCVSIPLTRTFEAMFDYAEVRGRGGLGTVVTFAAGNDGCDIVDNEFLSDSTAFVVAAVERDDQRAGYSSFGEAVDIAAPTGLLTTDLIPNGYGSYRDEDAFADGFGGTSAATPVVSGVVALMIEANPRLTAAQVREVLCQTATRIDLPLAAYNADGHSIYYGCGMVDAGAAVATVASQPPGLPVLTHPLEEAYEGRILLGWEPAPDADDDILGYELGWSLAGGEEIQVQLGKVLSYDLSGAGIPLGSELHWRLRAYDTWGPGEWTEEAVFSYVPIPMETSELPGEDPGTCQHGGGVGVWAAGAALPLLRRRIRR